MRGRHICRGCILTPLQGAEVANDGPAIDHGDARSVRHHCIFTVSDRVENFAVGHRADPVLLQTLHCGKTVLFYDAVARSRTTVADRAIDTEPLPAALH